MPTSLVLQFAGTIKETISVPLKNLDPKYIKIPASIVVEAGNNSVEIPVMGLTETSVPARILATFKNISLEASVTVLSHDSKAYLVSMSPQNLTMPLNSSADFVVGLDRPAPMGGTTVRFFLEEENTAPFGLTSPLELQIDYNQMEGTVSFQSYDVTGEAILKAYDEFGTMSESNIAALEMSTEPIDISGWSMTQANKESTFTFPADTILYPGEYVIISRNSDRGPFEAAWLGEGQTLGDNVHFFNTGNQFMVLNGSTTTFDLKNAQGGLVDGPTFDLKDNRTYQRIMPVAPADLEDSWVMMTGATPGPGTDSTPGFGQTILAPPAGVYISEISDAKGSGNYPYEYIEIYYDGPNPADEAAEPAPSNP
jgi:hypothetical protein